MLFRVNCNRSTSAEAAYVQAEREAEYEECYNSRERDSILGPLPPELRNYKGKPYKADYRINY